MCPLRVGEQNHRNDPRRNSRESHGLLLCACPPAACRDSTKATTRVAFTPLSPDSTAADRGGLPSTRVPHNLLHGCMIAARLVAVNEPRGTVLQKAGRLALAAQGGRRTLRRRPRPHRRGRRIRRRPSHPDDRVLRQSPDRPQGPVRVTRGRELTCQKEVVNGIVGAAQHV